MMSKFDNWKELGEAISNRFLWISNVRQLKQTACPDFHREQRIWP